jgi:hypothetical protein
MTYTYTFHDNQPVPAPPWAVCRQSPDGYATTIAWFYWEHDALEYARLMNGKPKKKKGKK